MIASVIAAASVIVRIAVGRQRGGAKAAIFRNAARPATGGVIVGEGTSRLLFSTPAVGGALVAQSPVKV